MATARVECASNEILPKLIAPTTKNRFYQYATKYRTSIQKLRPTSGEAFYDIRGRFDLFDRNWISGRDQFQLSPERTIAHTLHRRLAKFIISVIIFVRHGFLKSNSRQRTCNERNLADRLRSPQLGWRHGGGMNSYHNLLRKCGSNFSIATK